MSKNKPIETTYYRFKDEFPVKSNLYSLIDEKEGNVIIKHAETQMESTISEKEFRKKMIMCVWTE